MRQQVAYWEEGLPEVQRASAALAELVPPADAEEFHRQFEEFLDDMVSVFISGTSAIQQADVVELSRTALLMIDLDTRQERLGRLHSELWDKAQ